MNDILQRLKAMNGCAPGCDGRCGDCPNDIALDAIRDIEDLRRVMADALRLMECVPESGSDHRNIESIRKEMRSLTISLG